MFNYENRQMAEAPHTSASDFKVFTSINHVRFAHNWVDKKLSLDSGAPEVLALSVPHVTFVVLLLSDMNII